MEHWEEEYKVSYSERIFQIVVPAVSYRGRYAPSPTGLIHLGNARTALAAWVAARASGGRIIWRLEDLDGPRVVPGMAEAARQDLAWLGLDWDEGPGGGPFGPYEQSERGAVYEEALGALADAGRLFPCTRSRKDLEQIGSAPHGGGVGAAYPAAFRPADLEPSWYEAFRNAERTHAALRFRVREDAVVFHDRVYGYVCERVDRTVGDFVVKRRDGLYAYQLAVTVDDGRMQITEVVRGADLLASTARQIQLFHALGYSPPSFAHIPLVRNARGEKLSKRDEGLSLRSLRETGISPEQVVGYLGHSLGWTDSVGGRRPLDLVAGFSWRRAPRGSLILPPDAAAALRRIG